MREASPKEKNYPKRSKQLPPKKNAKVLGFRFGEGFGTTDPVNAES